jgi:hypothetical protein
MLIRKASIALLLAAMVGASLSAVVAGLLVCTEGTAPDCCPVAANPPSTTPEPRATLNEPCDCCVEIGAIPAPVGSSAQKRLLEALPTSASVAIVVAPPPAPAVPESTDDERDHSPSATRSAVLRR